MKANCTQDHKLWFLKDELSNLDWIKSYSPVLKVQHCDSYPIYIEMKNPVDSSITLPMVMLPGEKQYQHAEQPLINKNKVLLLLKVSFCLHYLKQE